MFDVISTVFWGLVLLTIIVFIHEAGHYVAARAFGVRVKEFMLGLPGPRVAFKRKGTYYGVTAVPLGGYCMIAGMEKGEEGQALERSLAFIAYFGQVCLEQAERADEQVDFDLVDGLDTLADWGTVRRYKARGLYHYAIAEATIEGVCYEEGQRRNIADPSAFLASERKLTYAALPWWKRLVILFAGSVSNLVTAFVVLIVLILINGTQVASTAVDSVAEGSPAAAAGLVPGDELVSLDGQSIDSWQGFITAVKEHKVGDEIELGYVRDGKEHTATVTLADNEGSPIVGVVSRLEREPVGVVEAAQASFALIGMTFTAILQLINPTTFADTIGQASSVVGISIEASSAAAAGPFSFILLVAALSISIGFMNLLPIPPLDGGKIIIETIERIAGRRLPASIVNGVSLVGFAAMILIFVIATNSDIQRYFLGG